MAPEADLLAAVRAGRPGAAELLYQRHVAKVRARVTADLRRSDAAAVDDVVAEAFTRLFEVMAAGGGPIVDALPYLFATARNLLADRGRHVRRVVPVGDLDDLVSRRSLGDTDADGRLPDSASVGETDVFDVSARFDVEAACFALVRLRPEWRTVIVRVVMSGESITDLARELGISSPALASRNYRATEGLRQGYLQAHCGPALADACRECAESLGGFVRGVLGARARRAVERHLAACARCSADEASLREVNAGLPRAGLHRPWHSPTSSPRFSDGG